MPAPLSILYQDDYLVAVNKPAGMLVHAGREPEPDEQIAMKMLRNRLERFVYTVHRLDRPTSGVLLFALHPSVQTELHRQFEERSVCKRYLAWVRGDVPKRLELTQSLPGKDPTQLLACRTDVRRVATIRLPMSESAFSGDTVSLIWVCPQTGRYHQIRRHMQATGWPIVGDYLYGDSDFNNHFATITGKERMMLHARQLRFIHPVTRQRMCVKAPVPDRFQLSGCGR